MAKKKPISPAYRVYVAQQLANMSRNTGVADNTEVSIPSVTPQEREAAAYYNPPVIQASSGDRKLDFVYNNQWLMNAPIVGKMIKNAAYNVASNSGGAPILDSSDVETKKAGEYRGQDPNSTGSRVGKNMLDVYFGRSTLPSSKYKPTSDYMEFLPSYSVKGNFESDDRSLTSKFPELLKNVISDAFSGYDDIPDTEVKGIETVNQFLKDRKPVYLSRDENSEFVEEVLGVDMGGHKIGLAWDDEADLPYMSISDAWDFEPQHYASKWGQDKNLTEGGDYSRAYVQSSLMHRAGKPFKVYDRFYFDPKTRAYIADSEIEGRRKSK